MKYNPHLIFLLFVSIFLLTSCLSSHPQQVHTPTILVHQGEETLRPGKTSASPVDLRTNTPTTTRFLSPSPIFTTASPTITATVSPTRTLFPTITSTTLPLQANWLKLPAQPISLNNVKDLKFQNVLGMPGFSSKISTNNEYLAVASYKRLALFDFKTLKEIVLSKGSPTSFEGTVDIVFSPNSQYLAAIVENLSISPNGGVYLWQTGSGNLAFTIPATDGNYMFYAMAFSPDSSMLALGGFFGDIVLYDVEKKRIIRRIDTYDISVDGLAFSPDGQILATVSNTNDIAIWDITDKSQLFSGKSEKIDKDNFYGFESLAFSSDGKYLVTGTRLGYVEIWQVVPDTYQLQRERAWFADNKSIESIAISPDGTLLVTSSDKGVQFWSMRDGSLLNSLKGYQCQVSFSSDGTLLSCGSQFFAVK